jgi:hypothetical protein
MSATKQQADRLALALMQARGLPDTDDNYDAAMAEILSACESVTA